MPSTLWLIVLTGILTACGPPDHGPGPWQCQDVGQFRGATNIAENRTKILTTKGEFVVYDNVSGLWGDTVIVCHRTPASTGNEPTFIVRLSDHSYRVAQ